jgi:hypothetical protein
LFPPVLQSSIQKQDAEVKLSEIQINVVQLKLMGPMRALLTAHAVISFACFFYQGVYNQSALSPKESRLKQLMIEFAKVGA